MVGDHTQSSFFRKNDVGNVHLNTSGKMRLGEILKSALEEVVYRSKLENEFEIRVK